MKRILFLFLIFGITTAQAQVKEQPADKKSAMEKSREKEERLTDPVPKEFQFIGYSFFRTTTSNVTPTNDVLQGQVIGAIIWPEFNGDG